MNDQPTDSSGDGSSDGVVIPEEFQKQVGAVIKGAKTKHHLNHISDRVSARHDELRKEAMAKESENSGKKGAKANVPDTMSLEGGPVNY